MILLFHKVHGNKANVDMIEIEYDLCWSMDIHCTVFMKNYGISSQKYLKAKKKRTVWCMLSSIATAALQNNQFAAVFIGFVNISSSRMKYQNEKSK